MIWSGGRLSHYLKIPWILYIGIAVIATSLVLHLFAKVHYSRQYDLFLQGSLLVWLSYWQGDYRLDAPVFKSYPIYFVLLSVLVTQFLIYRRNRFDREELRLMRWIYQARLFQAHYLIFLVLLGLVLVNHYLIYPIAVTLFVVRYSLAVCLE